MQRKEMLKTYFTEHEADLRSHLIQLITAMVKERTVNVIPEKLPDHPYLKIRGEEYRAAAYVTAAFDAAGIPYQSYARTEGRPNVIGTLGRGETGEVLMMPGHMDVVPAGEGWDTDPYTVVEKDGCLFGRGVLDNKGPLVSILIAAEVLKATGIDESFKGQLMIAALSDEEAEDPSGVDYGIGYLLEEKLIQPTIAVIPDIGENMKKIDVAEKGRAVIKITARGKQAHGSTPQRGINAVYMMAKLVTRIETLDLQHDIHPLLGHPTLNLGEIQGGAAPNVVPGTCAIYLDIRSVPGMTRAGVLEQLQGCMDAVEGGSFELEVLSWKIPHAVDPDNRVVRAIQKNAHDLLGFTPVTIGMGGGTYAKKLVQNGVLAVGWGPGDDTAFHVANEYVAIKQLIDFALLTCYVAIDLIG